MSKVRVGVVGLRRGASHLRAFQAQPEVQVVAGCDIRKEVTERVARQYSVPRIYTEYEQMLDDKDVDIIVIATPDHLHGQMAIQGLEAGKHVLSEIPMALKLSEVDRIIELVEKTGLKYHMGNQVRYAYNLQDTKGMIDRGEFGDIFYGEGEYLHNLVWYQREAGNPPPPNHWRTDPAHPQTTLLGGGPHAIDTLRWLMGVRFVQAQAYNADIRIPGWTGTMTTVAIFKADNGAVAKVTASYGMVRPYCLYYSVYGTKATFERTRNQDLRKEATEELMFFEGLARSHTMIPVTVNWWVNPGISTRSGHGNTDDEQAQRFLRAVRQDTMPDINAWEAARSIAAGICALQSAVENRPVNIPQY